MIWIIGYVFIGFVTIAIASYANVRVLAAAFNKNEHTDVLTALALVGLFWPLVFLWAVLYIPFQWAILIGIKAGVRKAKRGGTA